MPLARLENFLKNLNGNTLYVDPNELDSSDSIENRGNSRTRPFKTIQRALIEAANFSYVPGSNNDLFDQTTILISPGTHYVDNRPGYYYDGTQLLDATGASRTITQFSVNSNFNLSESNNELYIYNSADGGVIIPKGVSLVATDLRKTKIRPKFVPDPANPNIQRTSIFRLTGGSYIYGFTIFDGDPVGRVYNTYSESTVNPVYSHHKLTAFEYVDNKNKYTKNGITYTKTDLEIYYYKLSLAYGSFSGRDIINGFDSFQPNTEENKIVGDLGQGPVEITDAISGDGATATTTVTVTTSTAHNLTPFTPIQITGLALNSLTGSQQFNGNFVVAQVINSTQFTYLLPTAPILADPTLTNAEVTVLSDTITSSSPYIFNCSLKSVYGMNGLHADGSKVTGFKSMVTAQFTGISLQRDDRAFLKYDSVSGGYVSQEDLGSSTSLHQDSSSIYKPDWESFHIKASNDAFIQCVSIFAIGYAKQFVADSGGDQSITNSNSNFGAISLVSRGFKDYELSKDNHGFITHIIPPKEVSSETSDIVCYNIDVELTTSLRTSYSPNNTRIYLKGFDDEFDPPKSKIRGYTIGGKSGDQIFLGSPSGVISATINPNYETSYNIESINSAQDILILEGTVTGISTGQAVRVIANNAVLPDGLDPQKIYYIHPESNPASNTIKLSSTIDGTDIVNIINDIGIEVEDNLKLVSRVSDSLPDNEGNPIQWDSTNLNWYLQISSNSSFIDNLSGLSSPTFNIRRIIDTRTSDDKVYRARIVIPKEASNASDPTSGFVIQKSSTPLDFILSQPDDVDLNDSVDTNKFKLVRNNNIIIDAWTTTSGSVITANIVTKNPHNLRVGNKVNIYNLKSTSEPAPVGLGTGTGFNGRFEVSEVVDDLQFRYRIYSNPGTINTVTSSSVTSWLDQRNCSSQTRVPPYTILSSNRNNLPYFTCEQINNDYQIYKVNTIQKYAQNVSDGIYHVYLNVFKNTPTDSNFNIQSYKLSQNLNNIIPESDLDNVISDLDNTVSSASRSLIGKVDVSDPKLSTTKETAINYLKDFSGAFEVSSITKSPSTSTCTLVTSNWHNLNGVRTVTITSDGSGFVQGIYYDVPLCPGSGVTGEGATAVVTVSSSGNVTAVSISNPGSGYSINDALIIRGLPGSTTQANVTISSLLPEGDTVIQVLGSVYPENNGIFQVTVSGSKTLTYSNSSGKTESPSRSIIIPIQAYTASASYSSGTNKTTVTCLSSAPHPFLVGNTVSFLGVSGKFTVSSVTSPTVFVVDGNASGASLVYSSGLTSQIKDTNSINENTSTRQFFALDGFKARINDSDGINSTDTFFNVNSPVGLDKGDFIQIDDEILLVTRVAGSQIRTIRGALGTKAKSHVNGSAIRRVKVSPIELRRNSILRASGHTFEYTGFGPGNYSTGMPTNQDRVLSNDEILISQSLPTHGGLVVYTGMNSNGEFFIGRKKYDATTGEEINVSEVSEESNFFDSLTVNSLTINDSLDSTTALSNLGQVTAGITTVTQLRVTGVATASFFSGPLIGNVTGEINSTAFDTNSSGVVVTGIATATSFVGNGIIPVGGIIMWSGTTVPTGWALCDGSQSTPDLRNRFIVGSYDTSKTGITTQTGPGFNAETGAISENYEPGDIGGSTAHQLTIGEMPEHNHSLQTAVNVWFMNPGQNSNYVSATYSTSNTGNRGGSDYHENRPPYYALAFIMRVS
jgi:microcystin-dependent protein